ncbi:AAA family ATPase [Nocardiopsis composta]
MTDPEPGGPAVVFMCGPAGSGKTTVARRLEADGYVRLSIDEEAWNRGWRRQPLPGDVAAAIEEDLRRRLVGLVSAGADVVVDYSFWSRRTRDGYRRLLAPFGVVPVLVHLATPREVALDRIRGRTGETRTRCDSPTRPPRAITTPSSRPHPAKARWWSCAPAMTPAPSTSPPPSWRREGRDRSGRGGGPRV